MYKAYVFIDGERQIIFKFIISYEGLNSFFFSKTQDSKRTVCCLYLYKNSLHTQTKFWIDGEWNRTLVYLLLYNISIFVACAQ